MAADSDGDDRIAKLRARVAELESKVPDGPTRRQVVAGGGLLGLGGLLGGGATGNASAQAAGQVGTSTTPIDVFGYAVEAQNSLTDPAGVEHTGELADIDDVGGGGSALAWENVKADHGAAGDGTTDDTTAIQSALDAADGGGVVYFPPGTYNLTAAVEFGDNTLLYGDGKGTTTLQLDANTTISGVGLGSPDAFRDRQPLVTTKANGSQRASITSGSGIQHLTVDWNNGDTDNDKSPAPIWIDSADDIFIDSVEIINAESANFSADTDSSRGHALSVTWSREVDVYGSDFGSSNYRSVGIGPETIDATVENCRIESANQWRHSFEVFSQSNQFSTQVSDVTLKDTRIIVDGSNGQQHAITSHTADNFTVEGCIIRIENASADFLCALKIFDGGEEYTVVDNQITTDATTGTYDGIWLQGDDGTDRTEVSDITVQQNIITGEFTDAVEVGFGGPVSDSQVALNTIDVTGGAYNIDDSSTTAVGVVNQIFVDNTDPKSGTPEDKDVWFDYS